MLKISQAGKTHHSITLRLEGRVVGEWVGELRRVCELVLSEGRRLKLDLTEVSFADADGVAALTSLKSRGVSVTYCSPFVEEQLKTADDTPPDGGGLALREPRPRNSGRSELWPDIP